MEPKSNSLIAELLKKIPKVSLTNWFDFYRLFFKHTSLYGDVPNYLKTGNRPDFRKPSIDTYIEQYRQSKSATKFLSTPSSSESSELTLSDFDHAVITKEWSSAFDEYKRSQDQFRQDCSSVWTLLHLLLDEDMDTKVDANSDYATAVAEKDLFKFWMIIKSEATNKDSILVSSDEYTDFIKLKQDGDTLDRFVQRIRDSIREFSEAPPDKLQIAVFTAGLNRDIVNNNKYLTHYATYTDASKPKTLEALITDIKVFTKRLSKLTGEELHVPLYFHVPKVL